MSVLRFLPFGLLLIVLLFPSCLLHSEEGPTNSKSCGLQNSKPGGLLETSRDCYEADLVIEGRNRIVFDVPYETHNRTSDTLYLVGCRTPPSPVLEKRVDGEWTVAYAPIVQECLSPPWEIPPEDVRRDTLEVVGFFPGQSIRPTFNTEIEGTYRLRREIHDSLGDELPPGDEHLLPLEMRVSNTFELRE